MVSGKGSGYYGCHNARRKACDNKLLVSRKKLESFFMEALLEKVLKPEHLRLIYKKVEEAIKKQFAHLPEEIRLKKIELNREETRIHRFVEFVAQARATASIAAALEEAEGKAGTLKTELESLEKTKGEAFEPPPREWLVHRIANIREVLEQKTEKSALLLRKLTGKVVLTPTTPGVGKPYYRAKSRLKSFAVLEGAKGSNSLQWWRRRDLNPRAREYPNPAYVCSRRLSSADRTVRFTCLRQTPVDFCGQTRRARGLDYCRPDRSGGFCFLGATPSCMGLPIRQPLQLAQKSQHLCFNRLFTGPGDQPGHARKFINPSRRIQDAPDKVFAINQFNTSWGKKPAIHGKNSLASAPLQQTVVTELPGSFETQAMEHSKNEFYKSTILKYTPIFVETDKA